MSHQFQEAALLENSRGFYLSATPHTVSYQLELILINTAAYFNLQETQSFTSMKLRLHSWDSAVRMDSIDPNPSNQRSRPMLKPVSLLK
jgi:hypothetical protein